MRPQRSAHDEQMPAVKAALLPPHRENVPAHRVAGDDHWARESLRVRERHADPGRQPGEKTVAGARNSVLLVQNGRDAQDTGRKKRSEGSVAAEPRRRVRVKAVHYGQRAGNGQGHAAEGSDAGQSAAKETSHGEANERHAGLSSKAFFGPVKGTHEKQIYAGIAAPELFSHGKSRKDMPAGATGCQEDSLNHFFAVREKLRMSPVQSMVATRLEPP